MKKKDFYKSFAEALEISSVELNASTVLNEIDEYDSMVVMGMIAYIDQHFATKITARQIAGLTDIKSLMDLIGQEKILD